MTPKEKAEELLSKMSLHSGAQDGAWMDNDLTKQCALIAVDDTLEELHYLTLTEDCNEDVFSSLEYYEKVKQEIEKL